MTIDWQPHPILNRLLAVSLLIAGGVAIASTGAWLRERLARLRGRPRRRRLRDELREIAQRCAQLPTLDARSADEILAYDQRGLPR